MKKIPWDGASKPECSISDIAKQDWVPVVWTPAPLEDKQTTARYATHAVDEGLLD